MNHGHVQPNGSYHYHGLPTGFLKKLGVKAKKHSPLIGYAMDGYPIYALYGYKDPENPKAGVKKLTSSFQLKKGDRPDPPGVSMMVLSVRIMNMWRVQVIWISAMAALPLPRISPMVPMLISSQKTGR